MKMAIPFWSGGGGGGGAGVSEEVKTLHGGSSASFKPRTVKN